MKTLKHKNTDTGMVFYFKDKVIAKYFNKTTKLIGQ